MKNPKLTVLREVVCEELSSAYTESSETLAACGLGDGFTDVSLHGEPAERQTPVICVFLEVFKYLIGLRVVFHAAGNQVDLSAVYPWLNVGMTVTKAELPIVGQDKCERSELISNSCDLGDPCLNGYLASP